jgi:xanthine dehydrogenase accessory factor
LHAFDGCPDCGDVYWKGIVVKEIVDIIKAYERVVKDGTPYALATVVGVSGSAYRRPGARMLFTESGRAAGLINAACFEEDLAERAREVIRSGKARLVLYDNTAPHDVVFGLGLGCNGVVEVLLEPGSAPATGQKLEVLSRSLESRKAMVIATVVGAGERADLRTGDFLARNSAGTLVSTIRDSRLSFLIETEVSGEAPTLFMRKTYSLGKENVDVFFQRLDPPVQLLVFGAGADAVPLVDAARQLGWHVTVVDPRPAFANVSRFPGADSVLVSERVPVEVSGSHAAVIMTHNFDRDRTLLPILLDSPARYVGLLGPASKLRALLEELQKHGMSPREDQLAKLYAPVGLDIGAETPEEIALSIVAEIKAALENRRGGPLRDRAGPIHLTTS